VIIDGWALARERAAMGDAADQGEAAARHARDLLARLGLPGAPDPGADHPALAWRRSGLMAVTGRPEGPGLVAPLALAAAADGALAALASIAPGAGLPPRGAALLGERARRLGLTRRGAVSPNGGCRLLATADGALALNLPRPDDWELVPALLGEPAGSWDALGAALAMRATREMVERGRLLGLAIAPERPAPPATPFQIEQLAAPSAARSEPPLVVDLSALWAGPLAGDLLRGAGARVVKVESLRRPDGARGGEPGFFDVLNGGKASLALDFADPADLPRLRDLIEAADIVIEGSRPRALAQLGIDAQAVARSGATWVSITAYGRTGEAGEAIGFGDDAAVAGGVAAAMRAAWGEPLFAGDAIADPLTGITAALAAWAGWRQGGGRLVSLALAQVVAHAAALAAPKDVADWQALAMADTAPLYPLRAPLAPARALGADTEAILAEL